ncbi:hypothetical protein AB0877_18615 [Micromonospora sp. NPDC047644]|uniref:hypothetical protein n=1 Tax=Micromonospora sp. NPDC047644 TaxID=3157203 RepID=UPI003453A62E
MFGFIRGRNGARWSYRRRKVAGPAAGSERSAGPPDRPPAWANGPTVAVPRPGRAGWLTPAQTWRANGGRW